jgi:hypothetical protein
MWGEIMDDRSSDQQEFGSLASCSTVDIPFRKLFSGDKTVELMSISRVAAWFKSKESGQLRLPPIQRSFVWRNEQIVNYWDSLMRGYPAGLMMVTRADQGHSAGRNLDNRTETLPETAFHLFDGQQRLLSLLLGLGDGALGDSLRLWVDIGEKPKNLGDRLVSHSATDPRRPIKRSAQRTDATHMVLGQPKKANQTESRSGQT